MSLLSTWYQPSFHICSFQQLHNTHDSHLLLDYWFCWLPSSIICLTLVYFSIRFYLNQFDLLRGPYMSLLFEPVCDTIFFFGPGTVTSWSLLELPSNLTVTTSLTNRQIVFGQTCCFPLLPPVLLISSVTSHLEESGINLLIQTYLSKKKNNLLVIGLPTVS